MAKDKTMTEREETKEMKTILVETILQLTYGELQALADGLVAHARKRPIQTREEFAALLHEWAEAQ